MPLKEGSDDATVSANIAELMSTGKYKHDQAVAIAMDHAGRGKKKMRKAITLFFGDTKIGGSDVQQIFVTRPRDA